MSIRVKTSSILSTHGSKENNSFYGHRKACSVELPYANRIHENRLPDWGLSSSTLRHSILQYSFSKGKRFKEERPKSMDILEPNLGSTINKVSCSFGKGNKQPISPIVLRNAEQKPSPNTYDVSGFDQSTRKAYRGKSFGNSWEKNQKVYVEHRKCVYAPHFNSENACADYEVREIPGKNKRSFSLYGRLKTYTEQASGITKEYPGSKYEVSGNLSKKTKLGKNEWNFGIGARPNDFLGTPNYHPGMIYDIKGFAQKRKFPNKRKHLKKKLHSKHL